ncbi:PAAR-like domain-containing protein [Chondromyces apiculatus]|nr:PAAR-like domain-containing protein [Chondromyces apiculatus]
MGKVTALYMDTITDKSGHQQVGMAVSVCLTPAAPAPLPIPYPTFGSVAEGITDPCIRTKIENAKILTVGGCMSKCHGNEPGTLREVVSLNICGPCFPWLGAPIVFIELGMAGITGSLGQMNKSITMGAGGSASGAGGGGGGGGAAGGGAGGPGQGGPSGGSNAGGGGGGSNSGAAPPSPPASPAAEGQASGGHPVDVVTGTMFTSPQLDFVLPGLFYVQWDRTYRSSNVERSAGIGWGWSHSLHWTAERFGDWLLLTDDELRTTRIPFPAEDEITPLVFGRNVVRFQDGIGVDLDDGLLRVLRPDDKRRVYRLAEIRDGHGNVVQVEWTGDEVTAVIDTVGRRAAMTREGGVRRWELSAVDVEGQLHRRHLVAYELDERGDLVRVIDRGGVAWRYEYDEQHYLVREHQPDGVAYCFRYETVAGQKRCVETWGELPGRDIVAALAALGTPEAGTTARPRGIYHTVFRFGPDPLETTMTDGCGHTHRYLTNHLGQVLQYTDPRGYVSRYHYDDRGNLLVSTDGGGRTRRTSYDAFGRKVGLVMADGATVRRVYDDEAQQAVTTLPDGGREIFRQVGDKVEEVDQAGRVTTWTMDGAGLMKEVRHPSGAAETFTYDAHGNLARHVDRNGVALEYTWDLWGLPVQVKAESGQLYELRYDSRNEIAEVVEQSGRRTTLVTDALRNVVEETTSDGASVVSRYVAGVLVERVLADGGRFRFGYDLLLRLVWIENPAGERYLRSYDAAGNVAREQSFAGVVTEYEYDGSNRVVVLTRNGEHVRFLRDGEGRILGKEFSTGRKERFVYDRRGGVTYAEAGGSSVSVERDPEGRVLREVQQTSGFRFAVDYRYDALGRMVERRYSSGWGVGIDRRQVDGQPVALSLLGPEAPVPVLDLEYDARGYETERRRRDAPGVLATERDPFGLPTRQRLLDAEDVVREERSFTWSRLGPLSEVVDAKRGARRYALDVSGRPTEARGLGAQERFRYAPQGTAIPDDGTSFTVGRDGRPTTAEGERLSWDSAGRLVSRHADDPARSWQYRYDENNQLITATRGDGLGLRCLYDPLGRRVAASFSDGTSLWFGWDGDSVVEELLTTGGSTRRVFGDDGYTPLLETGPDGAWRMVITDGASVPWAYVAPDLSCSIIDLSTWGEVAATAGQPGRLRFAGQRADEVTGLHYNRHRYYAPDLHVFLTPDPLGMLSTTQDIGYVLNPTIFIDPLGLLTIINGQPGDPVMEDTIRVMKANNPGAKVITSDKLGKPPSIWQRLKGEGKNANMIDPNEDHLFITTHGAPGGSQWKGTKNNWATGDEIGEALNKAGFKGKGARVDTTICNGATPAQDGGPSLTQGIANKTKATVWGAKSNVPALTHRGEGWEVQFRAPRPWYNFWSKSVGKDATGKDYILGSKGKLYPGLMSGTPDNPTVHGAYVDVYGNPVRDPAGKPMGFADSKGYVPTKPQEPES